MSNMFCRLKDPIPKLERSGVYKLKCKECPAIYIGESGRQASIRIDEHLQALTDNKKKSAFATHLLQMNHTFERGTEVLLHEENRRRKRKALEAIEITRHISDHDSIVVNDYIPEFSLIDEIYSSS